MNQQIILDGKNYIILPQDEYQALVDAADLADAVAIKARINAGEETWPAEIVEAMVGGEHPIRTFRKYRGFKIIELAASVGISQPYLSEIENFKRQGTTALMKKIAKALEVDVAVII